jgi:DNA-binding SARP family transcriptional activator
LLSFLALRFGQCVSRDTLLNLLWPNHEPALAGQCLNSLIYNLRRQFSPELGGVGPVQHTDGYYRLNHEAGVGTDVACFEELIQQGDRLSRCSDLSTAMACYRRAVTLYRGDLWNSVDIYAIMERERLRASYLTLLARLADYHYAEGNYPTSAEYTRTLLATDPCREDAHRMLMRCYVRLGERAQALRQYHVCTEILQTEFNTAPEPTTTSLYEQVRLDPATI